MNYVSIKGTSPAVNFEDAILNGFAPDGGLYVPEQLPQVSIETLQEWKDLTYQELVFKVVSLFIPRNIIPEEDLEFYEQYGEKANDNSGFYQGERFTERRNYYHKPIANLNWDFKIDEETGEYSFKIQSKYQPKYYDASGNPIPLESVPSMFSGSELRVSGQVDAYTNGAKKGISLRLANVQVINPVSGGSGDGAGDFDAVDGFTVTSGGSSEFADNLNDELEDF